MGMLMESLMQQLRQNEITSIPSPFARIELVKEAFGKIIPGTLNQMSVDDVKSLLSGNTIYHKMVSDTLDVAQIFFHIQPCKIRLTLLFGI